MQNSLISEAAPGATSAQNRRAIPPQFATLFISGIFILMGHFVQADTVDIRTLDYWIEYPTGTFDKGEEVELTIHLNMPNEKGLHSYDLYLKLSSKAKLPATFEQDLSGSWFDDPYLTTSETVDDGDRSLAFTASKEVEVIVSDTGELLRIVLVADENGVSADALVTEDGGQVVIDNISFKQSPVLLSEDHPPLNQEDFSKPELRIFPNPVQDHLNLYSASDPIVSVQFFDQNGLPAQARQEFNSVLVELAVTELKEGLYLVKTELLSGEIISRKIVLE